MKKIKVRILTVLAAAMLLPLAGCGQTRAQGKTLTVGVRDDIIDFGYYNEVAGKYYGLEIDLAEELAQRLGYTDVEYITVTPETRKETLLNGEVDCLIAAYSIAETRLKNFDFSEPYYTDVTNIMVKNSTLINSVEQLGGTTVGVLSGSNAGPRLAEKFFELGLITQEVVSDSDTETKYNNLTVKKYGTYQELYQAWEIGEVDAACMDGCIARAYLNESGKLLDMSISEQEYGVATQKNSELSKLVGEAVLEMKQDGTIDELIHKWL